MNYPVKYVADENGNRCLPITHTDAVKDSNGTPLSTTLSEMSTGIVAPVNESDPTLPITGLVTEIGKCYRVDVPIETLDVTLPDVSNLTEERTVIMYLTGGTSPNVSILSTAPTGGTAPAVHKAVGFAIESGKTYEVNCAWNGLYWVAASILIDIHTNSSSSE